MELKLFVHGCFEQHYNSMMRAVDGLSPAEMAWTPNEQCSSIAFLVWHYGRTLDRWLHTRLKGDAQVWEDGEWAEAEFALERPRYEIYSEISIMISYQCFVVGEAVRSMRTSLRIARRRQLHAAN